MSIDFASNFPLSGGYLHEVCGSGAFFFVFALAAHKQQKILWIRGNWQADIINPEGIANIFDPADLLIALCNNRQEILACAETSLSSGAVPIVVIELGGKGFGFTEGRRLLLASKGAKTLPLLITDEKMGCNIATTRWLCSPIFDAKDSTGQNWQLIKNKLGTTGSWNVYWDTKTHHIAMVSPDSQRPDSKKATN